jgi:hypothetical protein
MTAYASPNMSASIQKIKMRDLRQALADTEQMLYLIWELIKSGTRDENDPEYIAYKDHQQLLIDEFKRRKII